MKGYTVYSKIQQMKQAGLTQRQAARQLGINRKTVKRYWDMPVDDYEAKAQRICRRRSRWISTRGRSWRGCGRTRA